MQGNQVSQASAKRLKGWQSILLAAISLGLALGLAGCTHSCLTPECGWSHVYKRENIPSSLEFDAADAVVAPLLPPVLSPATVADAERAPWYVSLQEALAMSLENGNVGVPSVNAPGQVSDDLIVFTGTGVTQPDSIRVLSLDPAQAAAGIEAALARFDAVWATGMQWNTVDQPTQGLTSFQNGAGANFSTTLAKPLPTGGVAGITYATTYQLLNNPPTGNFSVLNPSYNTSLQFGFEQPLLRGFGVDANEILPSFPGSSLFPSINGRRSSGTPEGILIARLRFDQQRAEFQRNIHFQVLNVESAYWNLYGGYMTMYAAEQGLRQAHAAWLISKAKYTAGAIDQAQYALVRAQYEQFRAARMQAMGNILNFERALRTLLGLPVEDGKRIVPTDAPTMTPYQPNWEAAVRDSLTLRPELVMARQDLQTREMNLKVQKNALLPDLRFQATYATLGLGTRLDGNGTILQPDGSAVTNNALRSLASDRFNNWTMGLNLNVPLGFRYEYATTRIARLQLAQAYQTLKETERRAQSTLAKQYSLVVQNYKLLEIRRLAREALTEQLQVRFKQYAAGAKGSTLEFLLDAQRQWATTLSEEYQSVVDYNVALAAFELARGTILDRNHVTIAEGPLPNCALVRAVEHERQRTHAIVLREATQPVIYPPLHPDHPDLALLPELPHNQAPSLPALLQGTPPVPTHLDAAPPAPRTATKTAAPSETTRTMAGNNAEAPTETTLKMTTLQETSLREATPKTATPKTATPTTAPARAAPPKTATSTLKTKPHETIEPPITLPAPPRAAAPQVREPVTLRQELPAEEAPVLLPPLSATYIPIAAPVPTVSEGSALEPRAGARLGISATHVPSAAAVPTVAEAPALVPRLSVRLGTSANISSAEPVPTGADGPALEPRTSARLGTPDRQK